MRSLIPKLTSQQEAPRGKFNLQNGSEKSIADLSYEHYTPLVSAAATPVQILLDLFRLETEVICCSTSVTAWQTNFKVNHIYSYGSNLFLAESVRKL